MDKEVIEAREEHVPALIAGLRGEYAVEAYLHGGIFLHEEIVDKILARSELAWSLFIDGEIIAMWGLYRLGDGIGQPWVIMTGAQERYPLTVLRICRIMVDSLKRHYPRLETRVSSHRKDALKWIHWMGFNVSEEVQEHPPHGAGFRRVWMEA